MPYKALIEKNKQEIHGLNTDLFYKILTIERRTPVYIAFSKNSNKFN